MKRKDFYIGLLVIAISLHILGFITSPFNFADFKTYLSWSPWISYTFYIEAFALFSIFVSTLIQKYKDFIKNYSDK